MTPSVTLSQMSIMKAKTRQQNYHSKKKKTTITNCAKSLRLNNEALNLQETS